MLADEVTIVVTSCKAYEDVREIFDKLFVKHWGQCACKKILVVDELGEDYNKNLYDKVISLGKDAQGIGNGIRVTKGVEAVETEYTILLQEDFLLYSAVNEELLEKLLCIAKRNNAGNVRFELSPNTDTKLDGESKIMEYSKGMAYRLAMQPGIWKTDYLYKCFKPYRNGAEFERYGSFDSCKYEEKVLGYDGCAFPYFDAISKGMWNQEYLRILLYNDICPDFSIHPKMSEKQKLINDLKGYIISINPKLVVKLQNILNVGKKY